LWCSSSKVFFCFSIAFRSSVVAFKLLVKSVILDDNSFCCASDDKREEVRVPTFCSLQKQKETKKN
jgi:hypothetical protein